MINYELYIKYRRVMESRPRGQGYCFAIRSFLGKNGLIDNHPLIGKKVINIDPDPEYLHNFGKVSVIESVHVHWNFGYYYVLLIRDAKNSHGIIDYVNINSTNECILESIESCKNRYEFL
jgi:hypothetical protein